MVVDSKPLARDSFAARLKHSYRNPAMRCEVDGEEPCHAGEVDGDTQQPILVSIRPIRKGSELSWDYGDMFPYEKHGFSRY